MKFIIKKTSNYTLQEEQEEKEIASLEELISFMDEVNCELILGDYVNPQDCMDRKLYLEIYDDYRE